MREQLFFISRENQKQTRVFIMNILQGLMRPLWTDVMQRLEAEMNLAETCGSSRRYEQWVADTMTEEMPRSRRAPPLLRDAQKSPCGPRAVPWKPFG